MGHMLGSSCNSCCGPNDPCCVTGQLPDTVTVTLSGPQGTKEQGPPLLDLVFKACFGSGAQGVALAPGGDPETDTGPVSGTTLTKAGSGYAKLGRIAPTLTVTGDGDGATFTPTLASVNDACGVPTWKITSVAISGDGTGYTNNEELTISAATGDTTQTKATLVLTTEKVEPTITADVDGGVGAELSVTLDTSTPGEWFVDSVAVDDGGSGYTDGASVTFSTAAGDTTATKASGTIYNIREEPELTLSLSPTSTGSGASLTATLEAGEDFGGRHIWYVSKIAVPSPGGGYEQDESVFASTLDREPSPLWATVTTRNEEPDVTVQWQLSEGSAGSGAVFAVTLSQTTDENGKDVWAISGVDVVSAGEEFTEDDTLAVAVNAGTEIAPAEFEFTLDEDGGFVSVSVSDGGQYAIVGLIDSVNIYDGGQYFRDTGVINSVDVISGGVYYREQPLSVSVSNGGAYYREDPDEEPYVADVTVSIRQGWPGGGGAGAEIEATVDDDTSSETFGEVMSLDVTTEGDGYLGWTWVYSCDCDWVYGEDPPQDHTVVAWRDRGFFGESPLASLGGPCVYVAPRCYSRPFNRSTGPYYLIRGVVSSEFGTFPVSIQGPVGKPGEDNGPIVAVEVGQDDLGRRFAYPGRVQDGPDIIYNARREEPGIEVQIQLSDESTGSGAEFGVALFQTEDDNSNAVWGLDYVDIYSAGEGYVEGDTILVVVNTGTEFIAAELGITLNENGGVESVNVIEAGQYARVFNDVAITCTMQQQFDSTILPYWTVTSVSFPPVVGEFENGQFLELSSTTQEPLLPLEWRDFDDRSPFAVGQAIVDDEGLLVGITIVDGGKFYNETSASVITADVQVSIEQYLPSQGSGAEISASINTNLASGDFGRLTLSVTDGGDGYLGGYFGEDFVVVTYPGPSAPPAVRAWREYSAPFTGILCETTLTADDPIEDCSNFSFEATFGDQTATVEPGGEVAPPFEGSNKCCHKCFMCCPEMPAQIVATFTREANEGYALRVADNPRDDLAAGGQLSGSRFIGDNKFFESDSYYIECGSHEIEIVWDVADLHEKNHCGDLSPCDVAIEETVYPSRSVDSPSRIEGTEVVVTVTMARRYDYDTETTFGRGVLVYWEVGDVLVFAPDGFTNGQELTLVSTTQSALLSDASPGVPPEFADRDDDRRPATGTAIVDDNGYLVGINLTDRGKFYNEILAVGLFRGDGYADYCVTGAMVDSDTGVDRLVMPWPEVTAVDKLSLGEVNTIASTLPQASGRISVFGSNHNLGGTGCGTLSVIARTAWLYSAFAAAADQVGIKTKLYTKPDKVQCGQVPGEWVVSESTDFSVGLFFANGQVNPGCEPDDKYLLSLVDLSVNSRYEGTARRICKNYEVSVEFQ